MHVRILIINAVRLNRCKSIEAIVVPRRSSGDVQRSVGVIETIRIDGIVVDGRCILVDMRKSIIV